TEAERKALLLDNLKLSDRKAGQWCQRLSDLKRAKRESARASSDPNPSEEEHLVLTTYARAMHECGWLDFDDLIYLSVELLETCADLLAQYRQRFEHVSVDEFQDIDEAQYRLIKLLVPSDGNLCVIGDPDQAIYSFRGAEPRFFQQFAAEYPKARTVQ